MPLFFFFFNDTATTEIYTLSLHDALPISLSQIDPSCRSRSSGAGKSKLVPQYQRLALSGSNLLGDAIDLSLRGAERSEEHTSELQSRSDLVCRLLLEKKK